ncbi:MAG: DUF6056 family protein [Clostridiales bacterium]|nr:DUF6056 family protein [Clostridiales bacterium]
MAEEKTRYRRLLLYAGLAAIFLILALAFHYTTFAYDDYGYISLSYGMEKDGFPSSIHIGSAPGLRDILTYLRWHYFNWGGRVVYYFAFIILSRLGCGAVMLLQACLTFVAFRCLARFSNGGILWPMAFLTGFMFMADLNLYMTSYLWLSSAFTYVWPSMTVAICLYVYTFRAERGMRLRWLFLFFVAGAGGEFSSVLLSVYCVVGLGWQIFHEKRKSSFHIGCTAAALSGTAFLMLAPGNAARKAVSAEYYARPFLDRFAENMVSLTMEVFDKHMHWVMTLLLVVAVYLAFYMGKR